MGAQSAGVGARPPPWRVAQAVGWGLVAAVDGAMGAQGGPVARAAPALAGTSLTSVTPGCGAMNAPTGATVGRVPPSRRATCQPTPAGRLRPDALVATLN
jgi:hypothetical protein